MPKTSTRLITATLVCATFLTCTPPLAGARTITGLIASQSVQDIDINQPITLTITKPAHNPYNETPAGSLPEAPLDGYTFTLSRVNNVDITQQDQWDTITTMDPADAKTHLTGTQSATTDTSGQATFTDLAAGLYYVTETPPQDPTHHHSWASPFLITLPTGTVDGTSWNYQVEMVAKTSPQPFGDDEPVPSTPPTTTLNIPTPPPVTFPTPTTPATTTPTTTKTKVRPTPGHPPTTSTPTPTNPNSAPGTPPTTTVKPSTPGLFGGPPPTLAMTGANVLGIMIVGGLLVFVGLILSRRKKDED